jgi:hypothetical protein
LEALGHAFRREARELEASELLLTSPPAGIQPKETPSCPRADKPDGQRPAAMRRKVSLSPIAKKPNRVKTFMPVVAPE